VLDTVRRSFKPAIAIRGRRVNSAEILRELPRFFSSYLTHADPVWVLPPPDDLDIHAGAWSFRVPSASQSVGLVKVLGNENDEARVTVGLAIDVPYTPELAEYVNYLNNKILIWGRAFIGGDVPLIGDNGRGPCVIVMQEIVFGGSLSFEFPPSMQNLLNLTARLAGQAHRFGPELVERFSGRLLDEEDAAVLMLF
jgi:hypothetical protein